MRTKTGRGGPLAGAAVFCLMALSAGPAAAGDPFTVAGVDVRAEAASAAQAQMTARAQGRQIAFQRLLQRLTPREYWQSLPTPAAEELETFQASLDVVKEHTNRNLYIATLDYHFNAQRVRDFLKLQGVPFSDSQASTILLLPVLETSGKRMLWEEANPWGRAWAGRRLVHELVPIEYAMGDLMDVTSISADAALTAGWPDVSRLAARYRAGEVIVAHAVVQSGGSSIRLFLNARRLGPNGPAPAIETSLSGSAGQEDQLFQQAIDALVTRLNEDWKQNTLVSYDTEREIDASVSYSSLQDWVRIRKALSETATVIEVRTVAVSAAGAEIVLRFAGTPSQLALNLQQKQLYLAAMNGRWQIGFGRSPVPGQDFNYGETPPVRIIQPDAGQAAPSPYGADPNSGAYGSTPYGAGSGPYAPGSTGQPGGQPGGPPGGQPGATPYPN